MLLRRCECASSDGILRREAARDGAPAPRAAQIQAIKVGNLAIGSIRDNRRCE
jgi:hypothetical protein